MKHKQPGQSNHRDSLLTSMRSIFSQMSLPKWGLCIGTLFIVIFGHLSFFHSAANAALNPDIAILNAFVPNNAPPGVPVTYQLTFRNSTGAPVNITSLSHTLLSNSPVSPPGSVVFTSTTPTLNTCGSTVTIINQGTNPGTSGAYTIIGGTIPAGAGDPGECTIELPVTAYEEGNHIDIIDEGVFETSIGENKDPTSATLQVDEALETVLTKSFSPNTIPGNGRSLVTIRITNSNDYDLTGTTTPPALIDELPNTPNQLQVDTRVGAPTPTTNCAGGTVQIRAGDTGVELLGGTIPANGSCTITFPVTQANGGSYTNIIAENSLSTVNQISNRNIADDDLNIQTEVSISKDMSPNTLDEGETGLVTLVVTNGGPALTNAGLVDNLPTPLVVANPADATTTCTVSGNSEPLSVTPGAGSFALSAGQIPSSDPDTNNLGTCEILVRVTADPGSQTNIPGVNSTTLTNTIPAGALTNDQNQTNADPTSDNVNVRPALVASKSYSNNDTISPGATTRMTISIQNRSNAVAATGVGFTDALPAPLEVAAPLTVSDNGNCGSGTLAPISAGDTTLSFTGGSIATNSTCRIFVDVYVPTGTAIGTNLDNLIPNDSINNDQGFDSNGVTGSEGRLQIVSRVVITKAFNSNTIRRGQTSTLIIRIENNRRSSDTGDPEPLTGVAINDNLPANLHVANPANFSHTGCSYSSTPSFSGTNPGDTAFSMSNASLAPIDDSNADADTCEIQIDVTEIDLNFSSPGNDTPRIYNNTTSGFTNAEGEPATEGTADLTVVSPLNGNKYFQSAQIVAGGRSTAVIQLDNSLPLTLTAVDFTDSWTQTNTVVADPVNASTTCGGTVTTAPGSRTVSFSGGTIPAEVGNVLGLCAIRFDVEMDATGGDTFTNTIPAGEITTNEGFTNPTDISGDLIRTTATLNVNKAFSPISLIVGDPSTLTATVTNPSSGIPVTEFGFTDTMPAEMVVFSIPNATTTCSNGTVTAVPGANSFTLSGADLGTNQSCTVTLQITVIDTGNSINEIPPDTVESKENVSNNQLAQATVNALAALRPLKSFNPTSVDGGVPSQLTLTVQNLQQDTSSGEVLQNVSITDNFPTDLFVASTPNESTNCTGGTVNAIPGGTVVSMTGATLAPQASCQIFVDVVSPKQGSYLNQIERGDVTAQIQPSLGGTTIENTSQPTATLTVNNDSLPPELLLVKRITAVNGIDITGFEDGPDPEDNDAHWPSPTSSSLRGVIDYATPVVPGDEIEYTIYYLNTGLGDATNVKICDRVPDYTMFSPTGYNSGPAQAPGGFTGADRGIVIAEAGAELSATNANDGDGGIYFGPGQDPSTTFPGISCNGNNSNGTVVVSLPNTVPPATGAGTPAASYGYIRFKTVVQ